MSDKLQGGILAGTTSLSLPVVLRKTSDNTESTGKVAADMTGSYWRQGGVRVSITLSDLAAVNSAFSSGGVKEVDATNMPGLYRVDLPDAAVATGADWVVVAIKVAADYVFYERFALTTNVIQTGDSFARIGVAGAGLTNIDLPDQAMNITGNITGNLSGSVGSVTGAVGSVTGNVGGNVTGSVGSVASGGITNASYAADTGKKTVRSNTAQAGSGTTITLDASASAVDDFYNNDLLYITGGTGAGQARFITDYVGATKVATVPTWITNPDNTSTFALIPSGAIPVADPWDVSLPGFYIPGQAGYILGNNLDATVSGVGNNVTNIQSRIPVALTAGGKIKASMDEILAVAQSATDLKDFADTGYDPATHKVEDVKVVDTVSSIGTGGIAAASFAAGAIDNAAIAANAIGASELATDAVTEIANGILDQADGIEVGLTLRQAQRIEAASVAGKLSGAATTSVVIRNAVADSKDRITATVTVDGNRTAVVYDLT